MTLQEIKDAVESGAPVHWRNSLYRVIDGGAAGLLIHCKDNDNCIGLTHEDGATMNGDPLDFYIPEMPGCCTDSERGYDGDESWG